jgi:hypothetical protein
MSFEASLIIGIFIVVTSLVALTAMVARRSTKAKEDELQQAASARGWKFEVTHEHGYRVKRWSGTTDGVAWVAEYLYRSGGKNNSSRHIARWQGTFSPGIHAPIVVMGLPKGKEKMMGVAMANGDGFFAQMAQKAVGFVFDKALDVYFGEEAGKQVDAGAMQRVDGDKMPGYVVMAADKDEATRVLAQGLEKSLVDAANDKASVMSEDQRPSVLFRSSAITLARMTAFRDAADIERFTAAGLALSRAFKFGRLSV